MSEPNCGTGHGGFKQGNTCAKGNGSINLPDKGTQILVDGSKYTVEGFNDDDTFPPVIAGYTIKDGYIVYKGRNGSEGVVSGTKEESRRWIEEVEKQIKQNPPDDYKTKDWSKSDGGKENIDKALEIVKTTADKFGIHTPDVKTVVAKRSFISGEHGVTDITLINPHQSSKNQLNFYTDISHEIHIASHETIHKVYSSNPELAKKFQEELKSVKDKVSVYHNLAGDFEGLIELGAAYTHSPKQLKEYSPKLYEIADKWAKASKKESNTNNMSDFYYIKFDVITNAQSLRFVKVNNRDFIVAPIKIIKEGILAGNQGALYYPRDEIALSVFDWNGRPIVLRHPIINGKEVSANRSDVFSTYEIGRVFNSSLDKDGSNNVEGWFDTEITKQKDIRIYDALTQGKKIEVSTGLYTTKIAAPEGATFNGTPYGQIATKFKPDHLAILPDEIGACSLNDGCGVFNVSAINESKWNEAKTLATNEGKGNDNEHINTIYQTLIKNNTVTKIEPPLPKEDTMNPIVEILMNSCKCLNNPESKKRLDGLTGNALKEVILENLDTIVKNDADGKFFQWLSSADSETKAAIVKMVREKMIGNAPPVADPKKEPPVDPAMDEEAKKKKEAEEAAAKAKEGQTPTGNNTQMTEEQYLNTLPPAIRETVINAKKITDNEKTKLINQLTAHITDNAKKQLTVNSLSKKTVSELQEMADLLPPQQTVNTQQTQQNPAVPLAAFFAPQAPVDNANTTYLQEEKLSAPTYNWKEMSKQRD